MKKPLFYAVLFSLACFLAALTGCQNLVQPPPDESEPPPLEASPSPEVSQEVHRAEFALGYDSSSSLDPLAQGGTGTSNQALAGLVYEGLFQLDTDFQPQYLLCSAYLANEDCTQWRFTLRSDVYFSDGTPLEPVHVVNSLNAARVSELYASRLSKVSGVSADEGAVTVTLSAPNGQLPALLDIPITLASGEEDAPAPLGTGPYFYSRDGDALSLKHNPRWWQEHPLPLESIPLREAATADERIAAFDTGSVTATVSDLTGTNALGYSGSYETWDCPTSAMLYLGFQTNKGFCRDETLRRAISLTIDRENVAQSLLSGHGDPAMFPIHPNSSLYPDSLETTLMAEDPARLLEAAGYELANGALTYGGQSIELNLVVNNDNVFRTNAANALAQELGQLGLSVNVTFLTWEEFTQALQRGNFDLYLAQVKLTADFDLSEILVGSLNFGGYSDGELTGLLSAYLGASGPVRTLAARDYCAKLWERAPIAPLCFLHTSVLTQWGAVSGLNPTQQNPFYQFHLWSIAE